MILVVHVRVESPERPPTGSSVLVEIQEVPLADARATVVASATSTVRGEQGGWLETLELHLDRAPRNATIRVHIDVDGSGRVSEGDFVTMASYPVPQTEEATVEVTVKKV